MNASAPAATVIDGLSTQLSACHRAVHRNIEGVSHEESARRPVAGNSANWVLGHIVASRSGLLKNLGDQPLFADEALARYRRGSDGNVDGGLTLDELVAAYDRSQAEIIAAMRRLSDEQLAAKSPFGSPAGADAPLSSALAAMVFHEAYHVGQLGLLRRLAGKGGAI